MLTSKTAIKKLKKRNCSSTCPLPEKHHLSDFLQIYTPYRVMRTLRLWAKKTTPYRVFSFTLMVSHLHMVSSCHMDSPPLGSSSINGDGVCSYSLVQTGPTYMDHVDKMLCVGI
jgi:hypothetical protein